MTENKNFVEKRVHNRAQAAITVQYRLVEDRKELDELEERRVQTQDVSLEGVFIRTADPLKTEDVVRLDISIPEKNATLFAFAQVVRVDGNGAGLRLMLMAEEDRSSLKDYLAGRS